MAMRTLLPQGVEIDRPAFIAIESHPTPTSPNSHCSLSLPHLSHVLEEVPNPRIFKKDSVKSLGLESSTPQRKSVLHPLSVKMTASKESSLPASAIKASSKPVCVPLTMSELLLSSPIKVSSHEKNYPSNPLILSLDEILDLHGCKCSVQIWSTFMFSYMASKCQTHLQSHLATTIANVKCFIYMHIYTVFTPASKCVMHLLHVYMIANEQLTPALPDLLQIYCNSHLLRTGR